MSDIETRRESGPVNPARGSRLILWLVFILTLMLGFGYLGVHHGRDITDHRVIFGLRELKSAVLMYRADNPDTVPQHNVNNLNLILQYLDNPNRFVSDRYAFVVTDDAWWVGADVLRAGNTFQSSAAGRRNLADRAGRMNFHLHGSSSLSLPPSSAGQETLYSLDDNAAWMWVYLPAPNTTAAP